MREVLVIGSGISGTSCAIRLAEHGCRARLVSPEVSERSQSVMAAGGINAVTSNAEEGDSLACHIEDTLKGGGLLAGRGAVEDLCAHGEEIIRYLEDIGIVFSVDGSGRPLHRAFGGQSYKRTHYCGTATGKLIVSALVMEARRLEAEGFIVREIRKHFHSALIDEGKCRGALLFDERSGQPEICRADAVVIATGGQNALFGKTVGSTLCDGYAAGKLFMQGAVLKNLEFIQYHPTTIETAQKRLLVSEAARGEGGRLFYEEDGKRVYFLEDKYGPRGNLMTRDLISREIEACGKAVFLDLSFLDPQLIDTRLFEVKEVCGKYAGLDITKEPIPVAPAVHYFMGGLAVHRNHETNIRNLYAVGECASMYHGANRLGGNALLGALYSGHVAADDIAGREADKAEKSFEDVLARERRALAEAFDSESSFASMHIRDLLAETMRERMGIVRCGESLQRGISEADYYLSVSEKIRYDNSVSAYINFSLRGILTLARAVLSCAYAREESRGAHFRSDHPETSDAFAAATLIRYEDGRYAVDFDREGFYEN